MALTFRTIGDAIREVSKNMGLTNGRNMNPYSNEMVVSLLARAHAHVLLEHEWDEMVRWVARTLNGTTGLVTQLVPNCTDWKNIRRIYQAGFQTPLVRLNTYVNPIESPSLQLGYRGLAPEDDNLTSSGKYLVQFYPPTNDAQVLFQIQREIAWEDPEYVLPIDFWLHVDTASWFWACDDGANPAQQEKFQQLMKKRMAQVTAAENSRPSSSQPNQLTPNEWWENDAPYS